MTEDPGPGTRRDPPSDPESGKTVGPTGHKNGNCALVNFSGEGPYASCRYCTLRIENCIQFRGQVITAVILVLIAFSLVPVLPHALAVVCGLGAGAATLYYLKYVARESETSIHNQWELSQFGARLRDRSQALEVVNTRLLEERAASERLQSQLRQAQQLEALGRLAAGVAHEINNPLTYVIGNLELLGEIVERAADGLTPGDVVDAVGAIGDVETGAHRIARIVEDIKLFSQQREDDRVNVDLSQVVDEAVRTVRKAVEERARLVVVSESAPVVFAAPHRLVQVVVNLLTNASHAIEGPASANEIRLTLGTDADGDAVIEVRDTGCGIPADKLERIFDPFYSTKAAGKGTGLGLAICRSILSGYGARITVESALGKGTCFRVTAPRSTATDTERLTQTPDPMVGATLAGARILVLDDEEPVVRLLRGILGEARVTVALHPTEAMTLLESEPFDLIVCDVHMPDIDGVRFYHLVKARHPGLERRILFSTGGSFSSDLLALLEQVHNPVLEKPYSQARARRAVASWLETVGRLPA